MNADPKYCPDPKCKFGTGEHFGFFRRRGSYSTKCRPTPTPRFQCKGCGKVFSSQSTAPSLNHTCAKIRAGVAVMARKTWTTTKSIQKLQDKLDIFIAVHNGYEFC